MKPVCGFGIRIFRCEPVLNTRERVISDVGKSSNPAATQAGGCLLEVIAGFLMLGAGLHAQQLTTLHSFAAGEEGGNPYGGLTLFSNVLFGTASLANSSGLGAVFALNTNGTGFTLLH